MNIWKLMYESASKVHRDRTISPFVEAGGVAAAVLTADGNIYVGVCIDTCSSLGICAERNAIANMITHGESKIKRVLAIMPDGKVGAPCGACRELMMQLDKNSRDIEILMDYDTMESVKLGSLCPSWWTEERFGNAEV
ncbi:MAG: cytidine deaminase [Oscillospiraceae bacterium]